MMIKLAKAGSSRLEQLLTLTGNADAVIEKHLAKPVYTIDEVNAIDSKESSSRKCDNAKNASYGMSVVDQKKQFKEILTK
jgi:hypothetical protein